MSSAEDGYCSSDSPRAESPEESQAAADAESPRAGAKRERDLCDIPASPSSPLPAAKRRYGRGESVMSRVCVPPAHGEREFASVRP
jgi:hypothetical protein